MNVPSSSFSRKSSSRSRTGGRSPVASSIGLLFQLMGLHRVLQAFFPDPRSTMKALPVVENENGVKFIQVRSTGYTLGGMTSVSRSRDYDDDGLLVLSDDYGNYVEAQRVAKAAAVFFLLSESAAFLYFTQCGASNLVYSPFSSWYNLIFSVSVVAVNALYVFVQCSKVSAPKYISVNGVGVDMELLTHLRKREGPPATVMHSLRDMTSGTAEPAVRTQGENIGIHREGDHHCKHCDAPRPLRAKHCHRCGRCVALFDHHCPWMGSCVGSGNRHEFVLLTGFMCVAFLMGTYSLVDTQRAGWDASHTSVFGSNTQKGSTLTAETYCKSDFSTVVAVLLLIIGVCSTAFSAFSFLIQIVLICGNNVTYDIVRDVPIQQSIHLSNSVRLRKGIRGKFSSPFDDGCLSNWWGFLSCRDRNIINFGYDLLEGSSAGSTQQQHHNVDRQLHNIV